MTDALCLIGERANHATTSRHLLAAVVLATLTACAGGGADTEVNPATGSPTVSTYTGPASRNGRRAIVQDQSLRQHPQQQSLWCLS